MFHARFDSVNFEGRTGRKNVEITTQHNFKHTLNRLGFYNLLLETVNKHMRVIAQCLSCVKIQISRISLRFHRRWIQPS